MNNTYLFAWLMILCAASQSVMSQESGSAANAVSQSVYQQLQKSRQHIDTNQYPEALSVLEKLRARNKKLTAYEMVQSWHITAYIYYLQTRYGLAIEAYNRVLAHNNLPKALRQSTLKTTAQLYVITEDYERAVSAINSLIDIFAQQGKAPKENWLLLLRSIYHSKYDFESMRQVLEKLINLYPKDTYLYSLAGVYGELGDTLKQLTMMEALYENGYPLTSAQLVSLANLYMLQRAPIKAVQIMQTGLINNNDIKKTENNLRFLSQAYYQAGNIERSIPPLKMAAKLSKSGQLYVSIAQLYMNLERWDDATAVLQEAIKQGGLQRPDTAWLMLGIVQFNQNDFAASLKFFELAQRDRRSASIAEQWIAYVKDEMLFLKR